MKESTKVTYLKHDKVKIVLDMDDYRALLKGRNDLNSAITMMHECCTVYLEDVGKLESLNHRIDRGLGFVSKKDDRYGYHGYVLSNDLRAKE